VEKTKAQGHLAMVVTAIAFGLNGPFSNALLIDGTLSPWLHMACRFGGACAVYWIASIFVKTDRRMEARDFWLLVGASLTGVLGNQGLFAFAISMTTPIRQSLMTTMGPVFTMFLAAIFLREPITWKKVVGVLIGLSGVLLLMFSKGGDAGSGQRAVIGQLIALAATFSYTLYLTVFKRLIDKYSPLELMKWLFLISFLIVLPFAIRPAMEMPWREMSGTFYFQLGFVVVAATIIAYLLVPYAQKRIRPTVVAVYNYGNPVIATIAGLMMGLETFTMTKLVAGILVIAGVIIVTQSKSRQDVKRDRAAQRASGEES
jgi:drug/metabolite transporter (DMT)-like permease